MSDTIVLEEELAQNILRKTILITGGTGLIGRHLIAKLSALESDTRFAVITRNPQTVDGMGGRVAAMAGDLRLPGLGVDPETWGTFKNNVTGIIHCAADIRFDRTLADARAINLGGTRSLLDLAKSCPRLERLVHVSTTYIVGRSEDPLPEGRCHHSAGFFSSYQQSKYEAEHLVLEEARNLPVAIYRPSSVIGDSRTGAVEQYNHFHQLLRLAPRSLLPILPGSPSARVDFVATDWVTAAMAHCFVHHFAPGSVLNFCAGPDEALPVSEVLDMVYATLCDARAPELVSHEEFTRYVRGRILKGEFRLGQLLKALEYLLPYFALRQNFQNAETLARLSPTGIRQVDSRSLLSRVLHHMRGPGRVNESLRRAVPAGEPVR